MDHGYQRLDTDRYRLHILMHDGGATQCGGFSGDQLKPAIEPAGSPSVDVCLMCAIREADDVYKNGGQAE